VFVALKVTPVVTPATFAVMLYGPGRAFAVAMTAHIPELLVLHVADDKAALAPEDGTAYVTVTPLTGLE
jgi:hypothetical protein